jgi:hypothetical protein
MAGNTREQNFRNILEDTSRHYTGADGVTRSKLALSTVGGLQIAKVYKEVKAILEIDNLAGGFACDSIYKTPSLNFPVEIIPNIPENRLSEIMDILEPYVRMEMEVGQTTPLLTALIGVKPQVFHNADGDVYYEMLFGGKPGDVVSLVGLAEVANTIINGHYKIASVNLEETSRVDDLEQVRSAAGQQPDVINEPTIDGLGSEPTTRGNRLDALLRTVLEASVRFDRIISPMVTRMTELAAKINEPPIFEGEERSGVYALTITHKAAQALLWETPNGNLAALMGMFSDPAPHCAKYRKRDTLQGMVEDLIDRIKPDSGVTNPSATGGARSPETERGA